jgi:hypothetical protein
MIARDVLRVGDRRADAVPAIPFAALCALLFFTVLTGAPFSSARTALLPDILPGISSCWVPRSATSATRRARFLGS